MYTWSQQCRTCKQFIYWLNYSVIAEQETFAKHIASSSYRAGTEQLSKKNGFFKVNNCFSPRAGRSFVEIVVFGFADNNYEKFHEHEIQFFVNAHLWADARSDLFCLFSKLSCRRAGGTIKPSLLSQALLRDSHDYLWESPACFVPSFCVVDNKAASSVNSWYYTARFTSRDRLDIGRANPARPARKNLCA